LDVITKDAQEYVPLGIYLTQNWVN